MEDQHPAFFRAGVICVLFFFFCTYLQDKILRIWFLIVKLKPVKAGYCIFYLFIYFLFFIFFEKELY